MPTLSSLSRFCAVGGASLIILGSIGATARAAELSGTLEKVRNTGTITIGHREASTPFSFVDSNKQPAGYAVDLCLKIVDHVKTVLEKPDLAVRYAVVTPQTRIPAVVDGTVDLECGSTTNTLARQQQVDFSAIYFTTGTRLLTWKADKVRDIEDLAGKTIAVVSGSTNEKALKALIDDGRAKGTQLLPAKDYADGIAALEAKRADSFATDDIVLFGLLAKSDKKQDLEVVGRYLSYDPYGVMFRRGDPDFRLAVNRALARVFRSGEIARIYAKWFDPISVPMSPLLKAGFELQAIPE
ncbi:amino acid ABC transporter substrate-binding protein [Bradyrhizobium iriomotense]|uniref:amino acid ABC transporter substrate-binding protein n=1 Tax=Bradyrhizobium iriomotense TaxID=441950 RepID=UPI001B8A4572|nr:amino acid ABC transporter substrate-binding protein [Bradyrhizobium iriomotense]MBR1127994.1 amino acid ABC transporter substrate-binding protein [Bradyrhizobium iriomotense]